MNDDFAETLRKTLEEAAATLAEQDAAWSKARAAFVELNASSLVSVDPELLDELERARKVAPSPARPGIPCAIRA